MVTRASVVEELLKLRVENGLLGRFAFTENGDITESPTTILRVSGRARSDVILGTEGGTVEGLVRPAQKLVVGSG